MLGQFIHDLLQHTFLNPQSPQTHAVSNLFWIGGTVATFFLAVPTLALLYAIVRFRYRPGGPEPRQIYGFTALELSWTVIPAVTVLCIFVLSLHTQGLAEPNTDAPPTLPGAHAAGTVPVDNLTVVGHQWWWELRYPEGFVAANEIHIPVKTRWLVALQSADVVHGFWVPQIGNQIYLMPGLTNHIWLEADRAGVYEGQCAEFCGTAHAWMLLRVIADPPTRYAAWVALQRRRAMALTGTVRTAAPPPMPNANVLARRQVPGATSSMGLKAAGAALFQQLACQACHAIDGTAAHANVGPNLTHIGGRQTLAAGRLDNTPDGMARWLRDPQALKEGNHMPNLLLSPSQVQALTAYLESLK